MKAGAVWRAAIGKTVTDFRELLSKKLKSPPVLYFVKTNLLMHLSEAFILPRTPTWNILLLSSTIKRYYNIMLTITCNNNYGENNLELAKNDLLQRNLLSYCTQARAHCGSNLL